MFYSGILIDFFPKDSPRKFKILKQIRFSRGWHLEFSSNGFKCYTQHSNAFEVNIPLLATMSVQNLRATFV